MLVQQLYLLAKLWVHVDEFWAPDKVFPRYNTVFVMVYQLKNELLSFSRVFTPESKVEAIEESFEVHAGELDVVTEQLEDTLD